MNNVLFLISYVKFQLQNLKDFQKTSSASKFIFNNFEIKNQHCWHICNSKVNNYDNQLKN